MGTGEFNTVGNPASHPGESGNTPSRFTLQTPEMSAGMMGHLTRIQTFSFTFAVT